MTFFGKKSKKIPKNLLSINLFSRFNPGTGLKSSQIPSLVQYTGKKADRQNAIGQNGIKQNGIKQNAIAFHWPKSALATLLFYF
jgi:hypothetical protein